MAGVRKSAPPRLIGTKGLCRAADGLVLKMHEKLGELTGLGVGAQGRGES
jgi:hypothetical protein